MLEVIHQLFIINYQGTLLKLMIHVLEHLRTVTSLLHELNKLLWGGWWEHGGFKTHLGMVTPTSTTVVLLLKLSMEVHIMLLKVYYHHGDVVLTIVVRTGLISYPLRYLIEWYPLLPELINHLGHLFLTVNEVKPITRQNEQVIIWLNLVVVSFTLGNQILLLLHVSDGPGDSKDAVYPSDVILHGDESIVSHDPVVFVITVWGLLIS